MEVVPASPKSISSDREKMTSGYIVGSASNIKRVFQIKMIPPLYQEIRAMTVPVSFLTLSSVIDEVWKSFEERGDDIFKGLNIWRNRHIFKKIMLTLAEAKVCSAQRSSYFKHTTNLPQREIYFCHELSDLNALVKKLPYPLAAYLDCIGNTMEGDLHITPVLAEMDDCTSDVSGSLSGGPRQLLPLLLMFRKYVEEAEYINLASDLGRFLPNFSLYQQGSKYMLSRSTEEFWLTADGRINISDGDVQIFQQITDCFDDRHFNAQTDLLKGNGRMAQTVQTPDWTADRLFRYYCMADISEIDQKLGATFGFSYTFQIEIQKSRYIGCPEHAYWRGEVLPSKMVEAMLQEIPRDEDSETIY